jgi:hypothetical protein
VSDLVGAQAYSGKSSIAGGSPTPPHWYWPSSHDPCTPFRCWRRYDRASPRRPQCSGLVITQVGLGLLDAGASPSWISIFPAAPAQEKDTNTLRLRGGYPPHCTCLFPCLQGLGRAFTMPLPFHLSVLARPWSSSHGASSPAPLVVACLRDGKALAEPSQ